MWKIIANIALSVTNENSFKLYKLMFVKNTSLTFINRVILMGYNGKNRRLRGSVIRKSSLKFGTKLISSVIAIPIAAALEETSTKRSIVKTNSQILSNVSLKKNEKAQKCKIYIDNIRSITDNKYKYIIADLITLIKENQSLKKTILLKNNELEKLKLRKKLFTFFPRKKSKIEADISRTITDIEDLSNRKQIETLNAEGLRNLIVEEKILSLKELLNSSKLLLSDDRPSFFNNQSVYHSSMLNRVKAQISFMPNIYISHCPALTITAPCIDLFFFGKGIIFKCNGEFAIIGYENLNCKYKEVKIKEDESFNIHDYTLDSYTFLYPRNDGRADLRYSYNPQIPIIKYGKLSLETSRGLSLNLFFNNYFTGLQLYKAIKGISYSNIDYKTKNSQYAIDKNVSNISCQNSENKFCLKDSDGFDVIVDLCNDEEINQILTYADSLVNAEKYKEANVLYKKLLNTTTLHNNSLYNNIVVNKIKDTENNQSKKSIDVTNMWNNEMHNLLIDADNLMENKKYKEAKMQYYKLLEAAMLYNNHLYNGIATTRLKELKNKIDLSDPCYPGPLFDIEMINEIIEDARSYEKRKDYKQALSKYIEVKMYANLYSSLPYINLAKIEIEKLKELKNEN